MTNKSREQAIEKIAKVLLDLQRRTEFITLDNFIEKQTRLDALQKLRAIFADQILKAFESLGYVQKAEDQSLPECPYHRFGEPECPYEKAQQDILKAGWVKVKTE